ncbi:hypothetical protein RUM44_006530 [Polyplax serrata]|uniref:Uncharacterized protein n=1 Tax=Polyplax serrata TaxID=468196 RepID=A0ABR1AIE2_POLSC
MASEGESGPSPEVIEIDLIDDVPDGLNSSEVILSRYPPSGWYFPSTGRFAVHHGHRALGYRGDRRPEESGDSNEVVGNELSDVGNVFVCGYHVPCCVVFGPSLVGQ